MEKLVTIEICCLIFDLQLMPDSEIDGPIYNSQHWGKPVLVFVQSFETIMSENDF